MNPLHAFVQLCMSCTYYVVATIPCYDGPDPALVGAIQAVLALNILDLVRSVLKWSNDGIVFFLLTVSVMYIFQIAKGTFCSNAEKIIGRFLIPRFLNSKCDMTYVQGRAVKIEQ